jgi:hypothetical protein
VFDVSPLFFVLYGEISQTYLVAFLRVVSIKTATTVECCPGTMSLAIPYESLSTVRGADP